MPLPDPQQSSGDRAQIERLIDALDDDLNDPGPWGHGYLRALDDVREQIRLRFGSPADDGHHDRSARRMWALIGALAALVVVGELLRWPGFGGAW